MKKTLSLFLSLVLVIGIMTSVPLTVNAASVDDLTFSLNNDGESYYVSSCNKSASGELVIPDTFNGLPVTRIGNWALSECNNITSVVLGGFITVIGDYAFKWNENLKNISISASLQYIGKDSFYDCNKLTDIYVDCNNENFASLEGVLFDKTFSMIIKYPEGKTDCSYTIPDTVTKIGRSAFALCQNLQKIDFSEQLITIEESAFEGCRNISDIQLGDGVNSIGESAFSGCSNLETISIPNSVTFIGRYAFFDTAHCNNNENWEDAVLYIDSHLISAKTQINSDYKIKEGTITIAENAFSHNFELLKITIPDSVISIGGSAFYRCFSLEEINLPEHITKIGRSAFSETAYYKDASNWDGDVFYIGNCLISAKNSVGQTYTVKEGTKTIADFAFGDCEELKSISVPQSVTSIGACSMGYYITYYYDHFSYNYVKNESFVVKGYPDSVAENYAKENSFIFIDKNHTHIFSSWITDKKATCTKEGSKHKECTVCEEILETATIAKTKHTAGSWKTEKKATVNSAGKKVKKCTECGKTLDTATIKQLKCSKPKLSKIENTADGVKITWGKVSGADKYYVYRKTSSGKYTKITTTTKTYYTDKKASSGKNYYYIVKAVNEAGSSDSSSSKSIVYLADTTLKTPSSTKKGIVLKWSKVTGADGYMVYRKTGSGSYSKIATVKGSKKVTYTDKKAKKGKTYTYKVKAYDGKTYSAYSNAKKIKDKY